MVIPNSRSAVEAGQTVPGQAPTVKGVPKMGSDSSIDIIDIRHDAVEVNLKDEILKSLRPESGIKTMPTLLLYNERGLQLFEEVGFEARRSWSRNADTAQITYLHEYFLTNAEIEVLERSADSIANAIPSSAMIMELGSGFVTVSGCQYPGTN